MGKRTLLSIFILFSIAISSPGQNSGPQFTAFSKGLQGKVKSVIQTTSASAKTDNGSVSERVLYGYKTVFYESGFVDSNFSLSKTGDFIYDYHYYWKEDTLLSTIHRYGDYGSCVFNKNRLPVYDFSDWKNQKRCERWFMYDGEQKLTTVISIFNGRTDTTLYNYLPGPGKTYQVNIRPATRPYSGNGDYYNIDSSLRRIFQVLFYDKEHKSETRFVYDVAGNVIKEEEKFFLYNKTAKKWENTSVHVKEYRYVYDAQHNWIQKEMYVGAVLSEVERRIIVYW